MCRPSRIDCPGSESGPGEFLYALLAVWHLIIRAVQPRGTEVDVTGEDLCSERRGTDSPVPNLRPVGPGRS